MNDILKIRNLNKSFGRKKVLENFTMTLEKGKVYGLLGKNGVGKTTLIKIIMGIIPQEKGEIYYKNKKISYSKTRYKREIGYIPEDPFYFSWMKIEELLSLNRSFYPKWNKKRSDEYLNRFSLDRKKKIKHLSRGMKLKLGLVIALASEPEFLILDDPTSGLDVPTRQDFLRDIIGELSEAETTILFSTHLVHEIEGIIDHLSIIQKGSLILDEDYSQLKKAIKRVRMTFETSPPEKIPIEGILTGQSNGNQQEIVIYPWNEKKESKLEALKPLHMEIEALTLEEIFVSFVSENPQAIRSENLES